MCSRHIAMCQSLVLATPSMRLGRARRSQSVCCSGAPPSTCWPTIRSSKPLRKGQGGTARLSDHGRKCECVAFPGEAPSLTSCCAAPQSASAVAPGVLRGY